MIMWSARPACITSKKSFQVTVLFLQGCKFPMSIRFVKDSVLIILPDIQLSNYS